MRSKKYLLRVIRIAIQDILIQAEIQIVFQLGEKNKGIFLRKVRETVISVEGRHFYGTNSIT